MEQRRVHELVLNTFSGSSSSSYGDEDDFIDMEISSSNSPRFIIPYSTPIQSREFEFQMGNMTHEKEAATCPADELFYKGKLLPLHLPPRIKMVEKLIQTTSIGSKQGLGDQQQYRNPLFGSATAPCTNSNTPLESSPSESCRVSSELHPDEYFFDWSTDITSLIARDTHHHHCHPLHPKKSWSRKIKHSLVGKKLKASRAYLKSIFNKSVESCGKDTCNAEEEPPGGGGGGCVLKAKECIINKYIKVNKKKPFGLLQHEKFNISALLLKSNKEMSDDGQRKSFSGAINWNAAATTNSSSTSTSSDSSSSSSSFSFNFNGFYELQLLKRSSSANMELDGSVEGAIAHCKQSSHKLLPSMKNAAFPNSNLSAPEDKHLTGDCKK